jgi:FAD synthase
MKRIGIYPGNFQPAARSHLEIYKRLKAVVGDNDVFVVTTDREPTPEAPLNFGDKEQIWVRHGVPVSHILKVGSLPTDDTEKADSWRPESVFHKFSANRTAAIIALNEKDVRSFARRRGQEKITKGAGLSAGAIHELNELHQELSERDSDKKVGDDNEQDADVEFSRTNNPHEQHTKEVWLGPDGKPQYYQPYKGNEHDLKSFEEHAYIAVMDDTHIQGKPISTTNIRDVLGSKRYNDNQKKKFFQWVFGWFDIGLYKLMIHKFRLAHQVAYPSDEPSMPVATRAGTNVNNPRLSTSTPQPEPQNRIYNPNRRLEEMIREILFEALQVSKKRKLKKQQSVKEYVTGMLTPNTSVQSTQSGNDNSVQNGKKGVNTAYDRQQLLDKKRNLEDENEQNKSQRKTAASYIQNYDQNLKKNNRAELDSINQQLSKY